MSIEDFVFSEIDRLGLGTVEAFVGERCYKRDTFV